MKQVLTLVFLVTSALTVAEANPSSAEALAPDELASEGYWDDRFGPLGMNERVRAVTVSGADLYVGGRFTQAGGVPAHYIARWDGSAWHPLGNGMNNHVMAIDMSDTGLLYAGGSFTHAGDSQISYIACWDGSSWHGLGNGVNGPVIAIATSGSDVYVGGDFTQAGGNPANYIARWDGSAWHPLGNGVNYWVRAIAVSGPDVFVGGDFTSPASRIARWDGSAWHPLGSGTNDWIQAITICDSDVYVGGWFINAGGVPANFIARWDGSSWHPLGSGLTGNVGAAYAIALSGSDVLAGGTFSQAGGNPASRIARWDGSSWHPLESGVSSTVRAIAVSGSDVYVGGDFTLAGGFASPHIACWVENPVGTEPPAGAMVQGGITSFAASPNPLTDGTFLSFQSTGLSPLTLEIYDTAGRLVRTQYLGTLPVGSHSHYWDGSDGNGNPLASGIYFIRIYSPDQQASTRVALVR